MNCNKTNYEYQCRDGKVCEYNQGIDYQSSASHLAGPCGQQNCWHSCFVCQYNHQNDCEKEAMEMKKVTLLGIDTEVEFNESEIFDYTEADGQVYQAAWTTDNLLIVWNDAENSWMYIGRR